MNSRIKKDNKIKIINAFKFLKEKNKIVNKINPTWIYLETLKDRILIEANNAFLKGTGYKKCEVIGNTSKKLNLWVTDKDYLKTKKGLMENGHITNEEIDFKTKKGAIVRVSYSAKIIVMEKTAYVLSLAEDMRRIKELESRIERLQKLEGVGEKSSAIVHDFNNILTAISGHLELLLLELGDNGYRDDIEKIIGLTKKGKHISSSLLSFTRNVPFNPEPVNLNEVVRVEEQVMSKIINKKIEIQTNISKKDIIVFTDTIQIGQVIMNLMINANDAMAFGGKLIIETSVVHIDNKFRQKYGFGDPMGEYALLRVKDTGVGIDSKTKKSIFEPFFTTKEVGKGTGLGLSIVYGIVKQHKGYIDVKSRVGVGTTFNIYLPVLKEFKMRDKEKVIDEFHPRGLDLGTVLLAEDDTDVRNVIRLILASYGYRVIEAIDGEMAVKEFNKYKDVVKVIILDIYMPGKNGFQVCDYVKKISPDVNIIFTSGYSEDILKENNYSGDKIAFIEKTDLPRDILTKIREILT